jgi:protein SCO1/2
MNGKYTIWLFVSAIMIVPVASFSVVKWCEDSFQRLPVIERGEKYIGNFSLLNQFGEPVTNGALKNKIVVADFFFTHCLAICPKMTRSLSVVQKAVKNDPALLITSFSIDPERDSVARLKAYATRFNVTGQWFLLTGEKKTIYRLARNSFMVTATDGDGGANDFIHSEKLVLVDKSGQLRGFYDGTSETAVRQLIRDIRKLKAE